MLSAVQNGSKKTRIMYQTNLSYKLLVDYLDLIVKAGLVCLGETGCYEITDKGRGFLEHCILFLERKRQLNEHINAVGDAKEKLEQLSSPAS